MKRVITGVLLIGLLLCFVWLSTFHRIALDMLILLFAGVAALELVGAFKRSGVYPFTLPVVLFVVSSYPLFYFFDLYGLMVSFISCVVVTLVMFTFSETAQSKNSEGYNPFDRDARPKKVKTMGDMTATIFSMIYPFFIVFSGFFLTKHYSSPAFLVLFTVLVPIGADTFALYVGSTIKGPKLCPSISPNKTIAGGVGALFGGIAASMVLFVLFEVFNVFPALGYVTMQEAAGISQLGAGFIYAALGLVGAVVGMLGDLAGSKMKRALGIKDFGNIFPGHGGFVDRIDSITYVLAMLMIVFPAIYGLPY